MQGWEGEQEVIVLWGQLLAVSSWVSFRNSIPRSEKVTVALLWVTAASRKQPAVEWLTAVECHFSSYLLLPEASLTFCLPALQMVLLPKSLVGKAFSFAKPKWLRCSSQSLAVFTHGAMYTTATHPSVSTRDWFHPPVDSKNPQVLGPLYKMT
jgi:hypothetical protein